MARELSKPLSEEDLVFLRQRYPEPYVQRMIALHGAEDAESAPETPDEDPADPESNEDADEAESGAEEPETDGEADGEDEDDDLIGDAPTYDPLDHTTQEVRSYLKTATEDERKRVKAVEQARTDREPRTSILNYDPS
jgi:hypothetical protein